MALRPIKFEWVDKLDREQSLIVDNYFSNAVHYKIRNQVEWLFSCNDDIRAAEKIIEAFKDIISEEQFEYFIVMENAHFALWMALSWYNGSLDTKYQENAFMRAFKKAPLVIKIS